MKRRVSLRGVGCLCLFLGAVPVCAADIPVPQPEAPTTIFSASLGSVDVALSLLGSWTAAVSFGTGLLLAPGLPAQTLDSFPGMAQGFVFNQTPDITASLTLFKHWFLDVSILGSFTDNSIQLGYRGDPGDVVQQVVLGTQGITIDPSSLLGVPQQPQGSLGATARLASGAATNDLLLRWDAATREQKTFIGMNELVEQDASLDSFTRGTYFFLPDTNVDPGTLQVLMQDPAGTYVGSDGGHYRVAGFDDVTLDSAAGLVTLRNPAKARVLVFYRQGGSAVGSTPNGKLPAQTASPPRYKRDLASLPIAFSFGMGLYLGTDMATRKVTVSGVGDCLLLWEPGDNSPFEIDNSYAYSTTPPDDVSKISYQFILKDVAAVMPTGVLFRSLPAETRFTVLLANPPSIFASYYPFADPDGLLYGPQHDSLTGALDVAIRVQFLAPAADMILDSNIVPGSVQVTVNGVSESRFTVDPASGKLTMQVPILPTDRIDVSWEKAEQGSTGGDILLAWRDEIPLSDSVSLSLSAGLRWNANPWTYTQVAYAKSGTIIAAAGIEGKTDNLSWSVQAGAAYTNPDTTGILRLFGMEGSGVPVDLSEDNAYPSSAPVGFTQGTRGELIYKDYRVYGPLGAVTLQPLSAPPTTVLTYSNGSRMGPYNVAGDAGSLSATDLVFDYNLTAGATWVGAQLAVVPGADADLSGARSVTIRMRSTATTAATVTLEFGAVSEDLDGTGVLHAEASSAQAGFPFFDSHAGITLLVGAGPKLEGNGKLDTEDRNGNGILDGEGTVASTDTLFPGGLSPTTSWKSFTVPLSDADRQMLLATRAVRVIIKSTAGDSGTIVVDSLSFDSAPFWPTVSVADRSQVTVRETPESLSVSPPAPGSDFASTWNATYKLFHPAAEPNSVLEIAWQSPTMPFAVQGFTSQGTGGIQYDTIVSYIRSPASGFTFTFSLLDISGLGAQWSVATSDAAWHEVRVSRSKHTVTVDGAAGGAFLRFDPGYGSLSQLTVNVAGPSATSGWVDIDEIYVTDPAGSFGAALVGTLSAKFPGTLLAAGAVPLLGNVEAHEDVSLMSAGFATLYGVPLAADDLSTRTELSADVLFTHSSIDLVLRDTGGELTGSGGHSVTIPAGGSPVSLTDAFNLDWLGGFSREDKLHAALGSFLDLEADSSANATPDVGASSGMLTQSWNATATMAPVQPLSISSTFTATQAVSSYPLPTTWYGDRWYREASLLAPWDGGGDVHRAGSLLLKAGIPATPLGFSVEAQAGADGSAYEPTGFTQQNTSFLAVSLDLSLGTPQQPGANVSLTYRRDLEITTSPVPGPRFQTEASELGRVLSEQGYMLSFIPVAEIFTDNQAVVLPQWSGAAEGSYKPTLTLSFQRPYSSRLVDLLLPSSVDVSVGQELNMDGDLSQTLIHLQPKVSTHALNLFGQLGAYPLFPGVRTDEYSFSVSGSVDGPPGTVPVLTSLTANAYASLTGNDDNALSVTESLISTQTTLLTVSSDLELAYDWKAHPAGGIPLPLLPSNLTATASFEHRETVGLTLGYQDQGAFHPATLVFGHATSLVFEGHGKITGGVSLGADAENMGGPGTAWRLALQISLEGKLTF